MAIIFKRLRVQVAGLICVFISFHLFAFQGNNLQLIEHLKQLSSKSFSGRYPGSHGHTLASKYIVQHLSTTDATSTSFSEQFQYEHGFSSKVGRNHLFIKQGKLFKNKFIIISAHYDHLGKKSGKVYYGADDNASGTAALLSLKPWLESIDTHYSLVLLATDAEEHGFKGAKAFLTDSKINKQDIVFNINLDMISYGKKHKSLYVVASRNKAELKTLVEHVNQTSPVNFVFKNRLNNREISSVRSTINLHKASDHYEFHKAGIPYLFITGENHKNYHSPNDTIKNINLGFYTNAFESIKNLIFEVDQNLSQKTSI
ncbi:M28 family peptidase [Thalassotalea psychrophila]|uniref:M28 family peptidase n=1 Tax=Thalassotalea psychrophila TaxID=3065647 RepID=A0ABY9TP88_9GAMM|nr:M28 family peptidase [Colwelliaceae bacterium SQ149]